MLEDPKNTESRISTSNQDLPPNFKEELQAATSGKTYSPDHLLGILYKD